MTAITIPIDGTLTKLEIEEIDINLLELDDENPRIGQYVDNRPGQKIIEDEIRFALTGKSPAAYEKLKESIKYNKGIVTPIWVEPVDGGKYKVIEGNTRVLIYKDLSELEPKKRHWKKILAYKLPKQVDKDYKNFIRLQAHLRGTNDWDAYEKAKYLYKLQKKDHWTIDMIEKQTKLTKKEIEQNIKAYETMQDKYMPLHENDPSEVDKFSYFVEYVKDKKLQEGMKKQSLTIDNFCEWVGDREKLPTGQDVRKLRDIVSYKEVVQAFLKDGLKEAMETLGYRKPGLVNNFYRDIERVTGELKNMGVYDIEAIANEEGGTKEALIIELAKYSNKVVKRIEDEQDDE